MPAHTEHHVLPYSPAQLFALVADVQHYPDFLPWCRAARILTREEGAFTAELVIHFKSFSESYVSKVTLVPPGEDGIGSIDAHMLRGPFSHLENRWEFAPEESGGTRITFSIDFRFRSRLLETLIGGLFDRATHKMVAAFKGRAEELYGGA